MKRGNDMLSIFTDGGINHGTSCGGAILLDIPEKNEKFNDIDVIKGSFKICEDSTNNEAELFGILQSLYLIEPENETPVIIFSDSEYAVKTLTIWIFDWFKNYRANRNSGLVIPSMMTKGGKPVQNCKLICTIISTIVHNNLQVRFKNVRGHMNPNNENDVNMQASYFKKSNNLKKDISFSFSKFLCTYNELIDKSVGKQLKRYKCHEKINTNPDFITEIRHDGHFEDNLYKKYYLLNTAIMNKYKSLIGKK